MAELKVGITAVPPFVLPCAKRLSKGQFCRHPGIVPEILNDISKIMNLKLSWRWRSDGRFGSRSPSGTWDGLVGDLASKKIDLAYMAFVPARREVVDFTTFTFDQSPYDFAVRRPEKLAALHPFLPFEDAVWWLLLGTVLAITVVMSLSKRDSWTFFDTFYRVLFSKEQQDSWKKLVPLSSAILITCYYFDLMILTRAYSTRFYKLMISYDAIHFSDTQGLAKHLNSHQYRLYAASMSRAEFSQLKMSNWKQDQNLWKAISSFPPELTGSVPKAMEFVNEMPNSVAIMPRPTIRYYLQYYSRITLIKNGFGRPSLRGFGMGKNNSKVKLLPEVNKALELLLQHGHVEWLFRKYSLSRNDLTSLLPHAMSMENLEIAFQIFCGGMALCLLVFLLEICRNMSFRRNFAKYYL